MSFKFEIKPSLLDKIKKLQKKDSFMFKRLRKKIEEIIQNPEHYKPLRYGMRGIRRVHLGPFVLIFTINEEEKVVEFLDFDHHDKIYL